MARKLLTIDQIKEAHRLRQQNYSKRKLAEYFNVGATTIWDNIFANARKRQPKDKTSFKDITTFVVIVSSLRDKGLTSIEIAKQYEVPIKDINIIWCKTL